MCLAKILWVMWSFPEDLRPILSNNLQVSFAVKLLCDFYLVPFGAYVPFYNIFDSCFDVFVLMFYYAIVYCATPPVFLHWPQTAYFH